MNAENFLQVPVNVQNFTNVTADEVVDQIKYCNILSKRKFGAAISVNNETIASAEAERIKVLCLSSISYFIFTTLSVLLFI